MAEGKFDPEEFIADLEREGEAEVRAKFEAKFYAPGVSGKHEIVRVWLLRQEWKRKQRDQARTDAKATWALIIAVMAALAAILNRR
jgi:hypothetical protein